MPLLQHTTRKERQAHVCSWAGAWGTRTLQRRRIWTRARSVENVYGMDALSCPSLIHAVNVVGITERRTRWWLAPPNAVSTKELDLGICCLTRNQSQHQCAPERMRLPNDPTMVS